LHKSYFKGTYGLRFVPVEAAGGAAGMPVTSSLYHSVHERDRICVVVKGGALGMNWYSAQACPWNGKIEFP
jgi:hypothetical protein